MFRARVEGDGYVVPSQKFSLRVYACRSYYQHGLRFSSRRVLRYGLRDLICNLVDRKKLNMTYAVAFCVQRYQ